MDFSVWLGLLTICSLGAMTPGLSLAMVVRHTLGGGRRNGIICSWAHSLGIGAYALVTLLGLAVILKEAPMVFNSIAIAGALYLIYIGLQALRSKGGVSGNLAEGKSTSALTAARDGLAISIFNPKIMLFFLALFSQFVLAADSMAAKSIIVLTPLVVDGVWYSIVAMALSHSAVLPKLRQNAALIDKLSGVVLILLSIRVLVTL
ncbi:LysE family translocator [Shewanella youngdeokensis]|uniref:LysE family translocator n=1 Tax=Shewanella youngdeokensis TaxID=2999068 RepID=A0ABZ0JW45_9GAMM|nr:LysE family translocator [Shewanella sp. DAU334]